MGLLNSLDSGIVLGRCQHLSEPFLLGTEGHEWVDRRPFKRSRPVEKKTVDTERKTISNPGMKEPTHIIIQNSMPAHSGMAVKHPVHGRLILVKRAGGDSWHCRKRDDTSGNLTILRPKDWKPDFGE